MVLQERIITRELNHVQLHVRGAPVGVLLIVVLQQLLMVKVNSVVQHIYNMLVDKAYIAIIS